MLPGSRMELVSQIGGSVTNALAYVGSLTSLVWRAAYFTFVAPFRGKPLRLQRVVSQALEVGVRALPILSLISFFIGLILALQAAYELRKFGALDLVATAVAVSMTRELGPLITAIVVIGRSGSAFAAEIGTMKAVSYTHLHAHSILLGRLQSTNPGSRRAQRRTAKRIRRINSVSTGRCLSLIHI